MVSTKPRVNFGSDRVNPRLGLPVHLHAVALLQLVGIPRDVSRDGGVADRAGLLAEVVALSDNVDFLEMSPCARDHADRKCVNEFVREEAAGDRREFLEIREQPDLAPHSRAGQPCSNALALWGARLDGDVIECGGKLRQCAR